MIFQQHALRNSHCSKVLRYGFADARRFIVSKCYVTKTMIVTLASGSSNKLSPAWAQGSRCSKDSDNGKIDDICRNILLSLYERSLPVLLLLLRNPYVFSEGSTLTSGSFNQLLLQDSCPYLFPAISMHLHLYSSSIAY